MKVFLKILIGILTICCFIFLELNPQTDVKFGTSDGLIYSIFCVGLWISIYNIIDYFENLASRSGKRLGRLEKRIKQLDKTDLENINDYYREVLNENTPLILGYIDDFKLDNKKIIAELLYLKNEKIINVQNGKIVKTSVRENLQPSEKMILDKIIDGKLKGNDFIVNLRKLVENECKNKNLVFRKTSSSVLLILMLILKFFMVLTAVSASILTLYYAIVKKDSINSLVKYLKSLSNFDWSLIMFGVIGITVPLYYLYIQNYLNKYNKEKGNLYKRTKKGRELNKKLEGLKNYLKDYSMMDEREAKEIELWDDYLIYSVMFGHNKKIIEEYEKYIEIN